MDNPSPYFFKAYRYRGKFPAWRQSEEHPTNQQLPAIKKNGS